MISVRQPTETVVVRALGGAALALDAWIPVLATGAQTDGSWLQTLAWTGLDVAELVALVSTVALAGHRSRRFRLAALTTAALFCTDAIVDVSTASGVDLVVALAMAVLAELPIAAACLALASRSVAPSAAGADTPARPGADSLSDTPSDAVVDLLAPVG
ncbi:hypothetical protein [Arsenicicoccus piscis]|uniref:Uncharacterized protein n=1 Tax=Arsenicicoccus piscis TaxID=673954 RepID=A0ABQ6HVN5_9MICO|nr:hypothetical protein [Arsenicicoccus piscis]GMA21764.1 hypothetical protein GCM10025862_37850 [Arsenicicoccus piscis]